MAGYVSGAGIPDKVIVEPSCGHGVFLTVIIERLVDEAIAVGKDWASLGNAIRAYDIDATSIETARKNAVEALMEKGCPASQAQGLCRRRRFLSFFSETNVPSPFRDSCLAGRPGGAAGAGRGERVFPRSAVGRARPGVPRGRAPITCDIGRVRCTHTMEPPSGGRRFGHPPGMGRAPRRMPRGPERGKLRRI